MANDDVSLSVQDSGVSISAMRGLMDEVDESPEKVETEAPKEEVDTDGEKVDAEDAELEKEFEEEEEEAAEEEDLEEGEEEEDEEEVEEDPENFLVAKDGDADIKIPKDAQFEVKVNGKTEIMTAQEIVNQASGGVHVARESSRLGRERKELEQQKEEQQNYIAGIEETVAELHELATSGDAFEFIERISMLRGEDFTKTMQEMTQNTVKYFNQFREMDETKRQLFLENRKLTVAQKRAERKATKQQTVDQRDQANRQIGQELESAGISIDEAEQYALQLKEALDSGEYALPPGQDPDVYTIIDFVEQKRLDTKVDEGIDLVDASLKKDDAFVESLAATVVFNERRNGSPMTAEDVAKLIRTTQGISDKKLSESLSRKAKRHAKSGAISKSASSQKQKKDSEPISADPMADHMKKLYG